MTAPRSSRTSRGDGMPARSIFAAVYQRLDNHGLAEIAGVATMMGLKGIEL